MEASYDRPYFDTFREASRSSAAAVAPRVVELVQPRSVVDVGCGVGEWAAAFKAAGVGDVCGVDSAAVEGDLAIDAAEFVAADLTQPLDLDRTFDLAVSLEVAEHLPPEAADGLVATLCDLAPVVLFSAAAPHQGGHLHLNEQWPDYWAQRFAAQGYRVLDCLRREFWTDSRVEWWYAQNVLVFATGESFEVLATRAKQLAGPPTVPPLVHPRSLERSAWRERVLAAWVDLAAATPAGSRIVLADEDRFGEPHLPGRVVVPFTEHGGHYAGPPADDAAALAELDRQLLAGADHFAFGWPAFWQREHYAALEQRLHGRGKPVVENDRVVLFRLR